MRFVSPDDKDVVALDAHERVQVVESVPNLALARRQQHSAYVRSNQSMVIWSDEASHLVPRAQSVRSLDAEGSSRT